MSKFNNSTASSRRPNTQNLAGGNAFTRTSFEQEVASVILNSMLKGNSYYETEKDRLDRIEAMIKDNPEKSLFLSKAMVYVRNEGNLRSVSHYIGTLLTENTKGTSYLKPALIRTMRRVDDMTEMVALWNTRNPGKNIPNSLRRAIKDRLENKFDSYGLKKYYGTGAVKVSNLINLTHPKPKNKEQEIMFKQALEGNLPNIDTAQTVNAGTTGEGRADKYASMLEGGTLGYMAALKNIVNILESGASTQTIDALCTLLENENAVRYSKVLPFRFTQAYEMVKNLNTDQITIRKVLNSIEQGFILSAKNVNIVEEGERVALLLDESGSMSGQPFTVGKTLMASMLAGLDNGNAIGYLWADRCREVSLDASPMNFVYNTNTQGGGTDIAAPLRELIKTNTFVDKIVVFSDMQMYNDNWYGNGMGDTMTKYLKEYRVINPNVMVLFWNLEGYGEGTPMKLDHGILEVAGFSDSMLSVIPKMWKNKNALVDEINAIEL